MQPQPAAQAENPALRNRLLRYALNQVKPIKCVVGEPPQMIKHSEAGASLLQTASSLQTTSTGALQPLNDSMVQFSDEVGMGAAKLHSPCGIEEGAAMPHSPNFEPMPHSCDTLDVKPLYTIEERLSELGIDL